jgi:hemerythrin-like domain-containing protein
MEESLTTTEVPHADVREMYMVHAMLRREFALMPGLVRGVAPGDRERARIVADHLGFVQGVLHQHHSSEDTHLWPKLLERGPEEIDPIVLRMEAQHQAIDTGLAEVDAAVAVWRDDAAPERSGELADALDRLNPVLVEHLDLEEEAVLPLIEKYITAPEWDVMTGETAAHTPPDKLPLMFGMMVYEGEPEVLDKVLSAMPEEVRPAIMAASVQAFAAHSEVVHGTATPPRSTR